MAQGGAPPKLARARRATFAVAAAAGLAAVFLGATAAGLALHMNLPASRRLAARAIGTLASRAMLGTLTVDRIDELGPGGIEGASVTVHDPEGGTVLVADGIRVRAPLAGLARSALFDPGEVTLAIPRVRIEHADVTLEPDAEGRLGIERAFLPRAPATPSATPKPSAPSTPSRPVRVWLPAVRIGHAWAHGRIRPVAGAEVPIDVELGSVTGSVLASAAQVSIDAQRFGVVGKKLDVRYVAGDAAKASAEARGTAEAHLAFPSASGAPFGGWGSFDGFIDDVQASARGQIDGEKLEVTCDLPRGDPTSLRAIVPGLPIDDVVAVHAHAVGTLPRLDVDARVELGAGELVAKGPITLDGDPRAELDIGIRDLDAHGIEPSWPRTSVTGDGHLEAALHPASGISGSFRLVTEPATVETWVVPAGSLDGQFSKTGLDLKGTIAAEGMPTTLERLAVHADAKGRGIAVQFEAQGDVPAIEKVPALRRVASGRAHWYARGSFAGGKLDSQVGVLLANVRKGDVAVRQAAVVGHVSGTPARPWIDASIVAQRVDAAGLPFRNVRGTAQGPATSPSIVATFENDRLPLLVARGTVRASGGGVVVERARVGASEGDVTVEAVADRVTIDGRGLDVRAFTIEGAGGPLEGALHAGPGAFALSAKGDDLDVGRLAALFRARESAEQALAARGETALRKVLPMLWRAYVDGTRASVDLDLARGRGGDRARLALDVAHPGGAALPGLRVHADGALDGRAIGGGGVTLELGNLLSIAAVPTDAELAGDPFEPAAWRDATGKLAVRSTLDLAEIEKRLPAALLPVQHVAGTLSTQLSLARKAGGPPDVELAVTTKGLSLVGKPRARSDDDGPEPGWETRGLDLSVTGSLGFAADRARVRAVLTDQGRSLAELVAEAQPPLEKILHEPSRLRELLAEAPMAVQLRVPRTPAERLPPIVRPAWFAGDIELSADLNGSLAMPIVTLDAGGYGLVPHGGGDLPLVMGAYATYGFGETDLHVDLTQPGGGTITLGSTVRAPLSELLAPPAPKDAKDEGFGERLRRYLLEATSADVRLQARGFRLAAFQPMLEGIFSQLDGKLDGSARIHQEPGDDGATRTLDGEAEVKGGLFQIPEVGQEFRNASARLVADGKGHVQVQSISAEGASGRMTGEAEIDVPDLELEGVKASFAVAENERVPLTLEGVSFGDAWGRLDATLRRGEHDGRAAMLVDVDVKELHTELPDSSARDVQPLSDNPKIHVGQWTRAGTFAPIALAPTTRTGAAMPWVVAFQLENVTLKRGASMNLALTGTPTVVLTDRARVDGDIQFTGGSIDVLGKRFEIDHGTAHFDPNGEPGNPFVAVTARWDAPDATRVYADYVGPLRTAKLALRSEPARSEIELDQLVLFGTTDSDGAGVTPGQSGQSGAQAAGIGGSVATAGLNRVLSGTTGAAITTRVDTSVAQNPKPEVAVQLSKNVTAEVAYALGTAVLGQNDRVLVTVGWHFRQRWSLSTTVGDRGTSLLDLIWQYRY